MEKAQRELDLVYTSLKCCLAEIRRSDWATKEREALTDYGDSLRKGVDRFISLGRNINDLKRSFGDPIRVPSSKYHALRARPGTSDRQVDRLEGEGKTPKGSPC